MIPLGVALLLTRLCPKGCSRLTRVCDRCATAMPALSSPQTPRLARQGSMSVIVHSTGTVPAFTRAFTKTVLYFLSTISKALLAVLHCVPIEGLAGRYVFEAAYVQVSVHHLSTLH